MYTRVNCMNSKTCTCTIINVQCIKEQSETRKSKKDFFIGSLGRLNRNTGHDKKSITCNTRKLPKVL